MRITDKYWQERRSEDSIGRSGDSRDPYQRDYARIIHSASFRRLQSKTQVLGLGESDFYRTRLTHSMEVAQIASGIVYRLREDGKKAGEEWVDYLPQDHLIQAIGLAHDLGHPLWPRRGSSFEFCHERPWRI